MTADALEMAVLIARRIIDGELASNPAALTGLIRSAVARLGESRKIQLRLHPSDAANVEVAGDGGPLAGVAIARVEIRADATLSPGDCIVDGEQGTVDGRVATRLEEVRRILTRALAEEGGRAMTGEADGEGLDETIDEILGAVRCRSAIRRRWTRRGAHGRRRFERRRKRCGHARRPRRPSPRRFQGRRKPRRRPRARAFPRTRGWRRACSGRWPTSTWWWRRAR